jgi:hypothetical protein
VATPCAGLTLDMRFRNMPKADTEHTPSDPDIAADLRQCVRGVEELWAAVQEEARADRPGGARDPRPMAA